MTVPSARSSWCSLKVKLGVNNGKPAAANTEGESLSPLPTAFPNSHP